MGRYTNGVNGPFIGKIGSVIGSSRNGLPYLKGLYKKRKTTISEKEALNRRKFAAAQAWLAPLVDFVRIGFRGYSSRSEGFIAAKSYLLKNVLHVDDAGILIDPSLMKVSYGPLVISADASVSLSPSFDELDFKWNPNEPAGQDAKDQVILLAYNINEGKCSTSLTGQFRSAGEDTLKIEKLAPGSVLHVYIAFIAADRSTQSESQYLGTVEL